MSETGGLSSIEKEKLILKALANYHSISGDPIRGILIMHCTYTTDDRECLYSNICEADVLYQFNGNIDNKSFIIKSLYTYMIELWSNEKLMYSNPLPTMEETLRAALVSNCKLHANCFLHERRAGMEIYVLEDLNSLDYFAADRTQGLSLEQSLVVMIKMAKFHAASMLYVKEHPDLLNNLLESTHLEKGTCDPSSESISEGNLEYVANMIKDWSTFGEISEKLESFIPNFTKDMKALTDTKISKFNVINHGDLWVNNILLKNTEVNEICVDAVFVNFQNCFWGSCAFDIHYFLNTSLILEVLKEHRQELIKAYCGALCETLTQIRYPANEIPSHQDIMDEITRCELFGLYTSVCEFPMVASDPTRSEEFNFRIFSEPNELRRMRQTLYGNERVEQYLVYTLRYFENINVI